MGTFVSPTADIPLHVKYNIHPAINTNRPLRRKIYNRGGESFHLPLPKFLVYFITGIFLSLLQWAIHRGKGRICVDCSNGPDPVAYLNTHIPKLSVNNADKCPPVYNATLLVVSCVWLWQMRTSCPEKDILLHCNDINTALRHILYHPDLAIDFAYILGSFLVVPVGEVYLVHTVLLTSASCLILQGICSYYSQILIGSRDTSFAIFPR